MEKRRASTLLPYTNDDGVIKVFLQKRTDDAKRNPGNFAFFGGGVDPGETDEQALVREIKEELDYNLTQYEFLCVFEDVKGVRATYTTKVDKDFEDKITVHEGDYGKFFTIEEIRAESKMRNTHKFILEYFFEELKNKGV